MKVLLILAALAVGIFCTVLFADLAEMHKNEQLNKDGARDAAIHAALLTGACMGVVIIFILFTAAVVGIVQRGEGGPTG